MKRFEVGAKCVIAVSEFPVNVGRVVTIVDGPFEYVMYASNLPVKCWHVDDGLPFDGYSTTEQGVIDRRKLEPLIAAQWHLRLLDDDEPTLVDEETGILHVLGV